MRKKTLLTVSFFALFALPGCAERPEPVRKKVLFETGGCFEAFQIAGGAFEDGKSVVELNENEPVEKRFTVWADDRSVNSIESLGLKLRPTEEYTPTHIIHGVLLSGKEFAFYRDLNIAFDQNDGELSTDICESLPHVGRVESSCFKSTLEGKAYIYSTSEYPDPDPHFFVFEKIQENTFYLMRSFTQLNEPLTAEQAVRAIKIQKRGVGFREDCSIAK